MRRRLAWATVGLALALAPSLLAGCASRTAVTTGPFAEARRIDEELRRGVSTKSDVERLLGKPNGSGASRLPLTTPREVWFYHNIETGDAKVEGRASGGGINVRVDTRQQVLLVFFDGDKFDGYMWWLAVQTPVGVAR